MHILTCSPAAVKPAAAVRGFNRWAAAQLAPGEFIATGDKLPLIVEPTPAEVDRADFLAWIADGGDPANYPGRGWQSDAAVFIPSPQQLAEDRGYAVGLEDGTLATCDAFPGEEGAAASDGRLMAFSRGRLAGRRERQRRQGEADALAGRPAAPSRFLAADYLLGFAAGRATVEERAAIMAAEFERLDWEAEFEAEMREVERHNRESGGWPLCFA